VSRASSDDITLTSGLLPSAIGKYSMSTLVVNGNLVTKFLNAFVLRPLVQ
jgi:hypothetical protein